MTIELHGKIHDVDETTATPNPDRGGFVDVKTKEGGTLTIPKRWLPAKKETA